MNAYSEARKEHALLLGCEGLTFQEIDNRLGVGWNQAQKLAREGAFRLTQAVYGHRV